MAEDKDLVRLPIVRVGLDEVPIEFVNDFVVQHDRGEFFLTVGQLQPPIVLGTREERKEQAERLGYLSVKVVARFGLTRRRLEELIGVLQENLRGYDEKFKAEG
ncbi:MAG: hypothetical protein SVP26_06690 [Chloroflexota bacterium]|nr:hypothetical protein [Chloroflexota bacterium]